MEQKDLDKVMELLSIHTEHDGRYCDTGDDMDWACRSDCVAMAEKRILDYFRPSKEL
jgi:hypothetical protein